MKERKSNSVQSDVQRLSFCGMHYKWLCCHDKHCLNMRKSFSVVIFLLNSWSTIRKLFVFCPTSLIGLINKNNMWQENKNKTATVQQMSTEFHSLGWEQTDCGCSVWLELREVDEHNGGPYFPLRAQFGHEAIQLASLPTAENLSEPLYNQIKSLMSDVSIRIGTNPKCTFFLLDFENSGQR